LILRQRIKKIFDENLFDPFAKQYVKRRRPGGKSQPEHLETEPSTPEQQTTDHWDSKDRDERHRSSSRAWLSSQNPTGMNLFRAFSQILRIREKTLNLIRSDRSELSGLFRMNLEISILTCQELHIDKKAKQLWVV
jgi:hypothetical protein